MTNSKISDISRSPVHVNLIGIDVTFFEDRSHDIEYEGFRAAEILYLLPSYRWSLGWCCVKSRSDDNVHEPPLGVIWDSTYFSHRQMTVLYCYLNSHCHVKCEQYTRLVFVCLFDVSIELRVVHCLTVSSSEPSDWNRGVLFVISTHVFFVQLCQTLFRN